MRFLVPVEARGIGEHRAAGEDSDAAGCLSGGGEDAKDAFAAGESEALARKLVEEVGLLGWWRGGGEG